MMRQFLIILCVCGLVGCANLRTQHAFSDLSGWDKDQHTEAFIAFKRSCKKPKPLLTSVKINPVDLRIICDKAAQVKTTEAKAFFEESFTPKWVSAKEEGLFTGYYRIGLSGSRKRRSPDQVPLYHKPADQYLSLDRKAIDEGGLAGQSLEFLYLDDPVAAFLLHVQGAGVVTLRDGQIVGVGYQGRNNHKYQSIGKVLIKEGHIAKEEMNATRLYNYLTEHPAIRQSILQQNPSYIFFKEVAVTDPVGAQGVGLVPERSLAVDLAHIPLGLPIWVETNLPDQQSYHRLMVAQDTGSAIKGKVRGDIYFGEGKRAKNLASHMQSKGRYALLYPKTASPSRFQTFTHWLRTVTWL